VSNPTPSNDFLELFAGSQVRLYRYIVTLVGGQIDAEDILQNVNLVMLRKCNQFQLGTNFLAWSTGIARFEVLKWRTSRKRESLGLSDATLDKLADEALQQSSVLDQRNTLLPGCMEKLPPADMALVTDYYFRGLSWEKIASAVGRTSSSVRHSICRIRRELKRCIDAALRMEEDT